VGGRLNCRRARQHPDLTGPEPTDDSRRKSVDAVLRIVVLTLLAVDGVISAVLGAVFLQVHIGRTPFPISALISGLVNMLLLWVGLQWTPSVRLAALPVWTFLLTLAVTTFGGPGGDVLFGGPGFDEWSAAVLLILGVLPAVVLVWRRRPVAEQARGLR
jgi:hypothetical protein